MKYMQYALAEILAAQPVIGNEETREDHLAWLKENQDAKPQFIVGDTITYEDADLLRPFIPVEQQASLLFEGMEMKIVENNDLSPHPVYHTD